jgi:short-subunit dehydrogenase
MAELAGQVALITGASSGIGAATAKAFAAEGVRVALLARRKDRLEGLASEVRRAGGDTLICVGDVTDGAAVRREVAQVLEEWGRVDILVNNAGRGMIAPFEATTAEDVRHLMETNLVSVLTVTQAVLPAMRKARAGHIINVSSVVGRRAVPLRTAYAATKFALVAFTECLRQELGGSGIRVSVVYPIYTDTEFHDVEPKKVPPIRYGPVQSAEQVARAIVRCVHRPRPEVYPYRPAKILGLLSVLAPGFVDWMMARVIRRRA